MSSYPVMIGWDGGKLSDIELAVLQDVALEYLRSGDHREPRSNFVHDSCAGSLYCKGDGVFGTFSGVIFRADLPHEKGEKRYAEFLVLQHVIDHALNDEIVASVSRDGGPPVKVKLDKKPRLIERKSLH